MNRVELIFSLSRFSLPLFASISFTNEHINIYYIVVGTYKNELRIFIKYFFSFLSQHSSRSCGSRQAELLEIWRIYTIGNHLNFVSRQARELLKLCKWSATLTLKLYLKTAHIDGVINIVRPRRAAILFPLNDNGAACEVERKNSYNKKENLVLIIHLECECCWSDRNFASLCYIKYSLNEIKGVTEATSKATKQRYRDNFLIEYPRYLTQFISPVIKWRRELSRARGICQLKKCET